MILTDPIGIKACYHNTELDAADTVQGICKIQIRTNVISTHSWNVYNCIDQDIDAKLLLYFGSFITIFACFKE